MPTERRILRAMANMTHTLPMIGQYCQK